ncbi:MAG: hypothetical protein AAFQ82_19640 [Myxococcota bacterium]
MLGTATFIVTLVHSQIFGEPLKYYPTPDPLKRLRCAVMSEPRSYERLTEKEREIFGWTSHQGPPPPAEEIEKVLSRFAPDFTWPSRETAAGTEFVRGRYRVSETQLFELTVPPPGEFYRFLWLPSSRGATAIEFIPKTRELRVRTTFEPDGPLCIKKRRQLTEEEASGLLSCLRDEALWRYPGNTPGLDGATWKLTRFPHPVRNEIQAWSPPEKSIRTCGALMFTAARLPIRLY